MGPEQVQLLTAIEKSTDRSIETREIIPVRFSKLESSG
jgi:hypothetical protein